MEIVPTIGTWNQVQFLNSTLYFCLEYGRQFVHNPENQNGYGGRIFRLKLDDGSKVDIKGPWSSRPDVVRKFANVNFVGEEEIQLDDGIVLYDPSGEINSWAKIYEYDGILVHEYSFLRDENGIWELDSHSTEQIFDEIVED